MATNPNANGFRRTFGDATGPQQALLVPAAYRVLHFAEAADADTDWNVAAPTHPTFYVHSSTTPATDYISLDHDATDGTLNVAGGNLKLALAGTDILTLTTAGLMPTTTNTGALGSATLMWEDLFLASGGVINFDNGNVTITHSAGVLTVDGAATVFNEAGADLDFRVESADVSSMFVLDAALNAIGIGGAAVTSQTVTITNATLNATAGRVLKLSGSVAAPNFADGYGAFEVDITFSGTVAGTSAASSTWVNIATSAVPGANIIAAQNNGIWVASGVTSTNAIMVIGGRLQYVPNDGADCSNIHLFDTNIYSNVLKSLFRVNAIADMGGSTGAQASNDYKVPLFYDVTAAQLWYVNIYHS